MQCPNCRSVIPDYHYYCPRCRIPVQDYLRENSVRRRGIVRTVFGHLMTLIILALFVGASAFIWRQINWQEIYQLVIDQPGSKQRETTVSPGRPERGPNKRKGSAYEKNTTPSKEGRDETSSDLENLRPVEDFPIPESADSSQEEALLSINSIVTAKIYIDGQYSGATPTTIRLTAGDHQVRLIADGYDEWTRRVKLKSRRQTAIMASMRRAPGQ